MNENNTISDYAKEFTQETKNSKKTTFIELLSGMIKDINIANILESNDSYHGNSLTDEAIGKLNNLLPKDMFDYEKKYFIQAFVEVGFDYMCKKYFTDPKENKIEIGDVLQKHENHLKTIYSQNLNRAWPELKTILSCSDFMSVFDTQSNNKDMRFLLGKCKDWSYNNIRKEVNASSLNSKDKQKVFAIILPKYEFNFYYNFNDTWAVFKDGHIDFNDLVTEVWVSNKFDNKCNRNRRSCCNAFEAFASNYIRYLNNDKNAITDLKDCTNLMIDALAVKYVIDNQQASGLKNQIDKAMDVGVLGIVIQFFVNLFSKGKTSFKPIQQTKQDRVVHNLKPLSGLLREATKQKNENELT